MSTAAILSDFNGFEWDGAPFSSEVSSSRYATDAERHGPLSHLGDVQPLHNLNRLCVRDTGALTTPCHPSLTLETDTSQSAFNNILSQFEQDPLLLDPLYQAPAHHLRPISPVPNIPLTHLSSSPSSGELLKKGKRSSRISNNCIGNDDLHVQSGEGMQSKHSIKQLDSSWADMNQAKVLPPVLTAGLLERRDSTMSNEESPLGLEKPATQVKMRSASHRPKKVSKKPALPAHVVQARECHNNVEKQYRTRLKQKFERLLAVLQASKTKEGSRGKGDLEAPDCGYSRGEVLDFARQRILTLEEENKQLSDQVLNLDRGFTIV